MQIRVFVKAVYWGVLSGEWEGAKQLTAGKKAKQGIVPPEDQERGWAALGTNGPTDRALPWDRERPSVPRWSVSGSQPPRSAGAVPFQQGQRQICEPSAAHTPSSWGTNSVRVPAAGSLCGFLPVDRAVGFLVWLSLPCLLDISKLSFTFNYFSSLQPGLFKIVFLLHMIFRAFFFFERGVFVFDISVSNLLIFVWYILKVCSANFIFNNNFFSFNSLVIDKCFAKNYIFIYFFLFR